MVALGMWCLGLFVGGLLTRGLALINNLSTFQKVLTTIIGAAFSGAVLAFLQHGKSASQGGALFMYPVGLLVALLWEYVPVATENIRSTKLTDRMIGGAHLGALVIVTIVAAALVLPPAFREAWAGSQPESPDVALQRK